MSVVGQNAAQFRPQPVLGILLEAIVLIILFIRDAGAETSSPLIQPKTDAVLKVFTLPGFTDTFLHLRLGLVKELSQNYGLNLHVAPDQTVDHAQLLPLVDEIHLHLGPDSIFKMLD